MFITSGNELTMMNLHRLPQRQSFMEEKLCYLYEGITMVLFILSFYTKLVMNKLYFTKTGIISDSIQ